MYISFVPVAMICVDQNIYTGCVFEHDTRFLCNV